MEVWRILGDGWEVGLPMTMSVENFPRKNFDVFMSKIIEMKLKRHLKLAFAQQIKFQELKSCI